MGYIDDGCTHLLQDAHDPFDIQVIPDVDTDDFILHI